MEAKNNVWALQLLRYFIFVKGYLRVSVINRLENNNQPQDYWLANASSEYDVIHISNANDNQRKTEYPMIYASFLKIHSYIKKEGKGKMIDISVNPEASDFSANEIEYVSIYPGKQPAEVLDKNFPDAIKVVYDSDTPVKEMAKLEKEIAMLSYRRNREHISLKKNLCTTFVVPAVISVIVWVAVMIGSKILNTEYINTAIALGAYYKAFITILNEYWRLLTAGFVHISPLHMLCNLFALLNIAKGVEKEFGVGKSMAILLVGIVAGNLAEFVAGPNQVLVGLSGGIYALFGAIIVVFIRDKYFKNPVFRRQFLSTLYINFLISLMPNVSWAAHLGGLVVGAFLAMIFDKHYSKTLRINFAVCLLAITIFLGYSATTNKNFNEYYYGTDTAVAQIFEKIGLKDYSSKIVAKTYLYYSERN